MKYSVLLDNVSKNYRFKSGGAFIKPPAYDLIYTIKYWWNRLTTIRQTIEINALRNLSAVFEPGDTIGIVGRNGSGKSTTCKLISMVNSPSSGKIHLQGRISYLLDLNQNIRFYYTGRKNIFLIASAFDIDRNELIDRIDHIIDYSGLGPLIEQPAGSYSAGMLARLQLSVALNVDSNILVLDEAFSLALGVGFRERFYNKIRTLADNGVTVIIVSHDLDFIQKFCNKVLFLDKGQSIYFGVNDNKILSNKTAKSMQSKSRKLKVFICHSSDDKAEVMKIYNTLLNNNIDLWIDSEKILPGQDWHLEISLAIRSSDAIVVCLSNKSVNKKGYVQKEIKYALDTADEHPEGTIFIIPVRMEDCHVPERLKHLQWVDYFQNDGHQKLMQSLSSKAISLDLEI